MTKSAIRILLVDDDPDILEFLSYNLEKEGFQVALCNNGRTAIHLAKKEKPHLIILDVMMPEMDGMESCEEIRKIPGMERALIVFLTARGEDYSQIAGFSAGADDYITKPIKPKVLISRVKALLKRQKNIISEEKKSESQIIYVHNLKINKEKYLIYKDNNKIVLPRKEFEALLALGYPAKKMKWYRGGMQSWLNVGMTSTRTAQ